MPPSPSAGAEGGLKPVRSRAERPPPAAPTHRRRSAEAQRRMRARGGRSEHVRGGRACLRNGAAAPHPAVPPPFLPPFTLPYLPLHPFPPLNPLLAAHRPDAGPAPTARLGLPSEVSRCPARHSTARHGPARRRRSLPRLPHAAGPGRSAGTRWQPPAAPGTTLPRVPSPAAWAGGGTCPPRPPLLPKESRAVFSQGGRYCQPAALRSYLQFYLCRCYQSACSWKFSRGGRGLKLGCLNATLALRFQENNHCSPRVADLQ